MRGHVDGLPTGLNIQTVAPQKRHAWARDETVYNENHSMFVSAFNVYEHTYGNESGQFVWGAIDNGKPFVTDHFKRVYAVCWEQPFANWITSTTFVIKISARKKHFPILAIDIPKGFMIVPNSDNLESRSSAVSADQLSAGRWHDKLSAHLLLGLR